jgi:hypothetical protein
MGYVFGLILVFALRDLDFRIRQCFQPFPSKLDLILKSILRLKIRALTPSVSILEQSPRACLDRNAAAAGVASSVSELEPPLM